MKKTVLILLGVVIGVALICATVFLIWKSLRTEYCVVDLPENYKILTVGEKGSLLIVTETGLLYELDEDGKLTKRVEVLEGISDLKLDADTGVFLALREDGTIFSFQLNEHTFTETEIPIPSRVINISTGGGHFAAITAEGELYLWGKNENGELGDGTNDNRDFPALIESLSDVKEVVFLFGTTMALAKDGCVYICGVNYGVIAENSTKGYYYCNQFEVVTGLPATVEIGAHNQTDFFAIEEEGYIYYWGHNYFKEVPTKYDEEYNASHMDSSNYLVAFIGENRNVYYIGMDFIYGYGMDFCFEPQRIIGVSDVDEVIIGGSAVYSRKGDKIIIIKQPEKTRALGHK